MRKPASSMNKGLIPTPVGPGSSGEGLPYAPQDWPCPGDKWRWKVGKRVSSAGYYVDKFLYPPPRFDKSKITGSKSGLTSRLLVKKFVETQVPDANIDTFFSSFLWRVPSPKVVAYKDVERDKNFPSSCVRQSHLSNGHLESKMIPRHGECRAGSNMCSAWVHARGDSLQVMDCDICCIESGFCRDCCCILCGQSVDFAHGGCSFVRCEAMVYENFICGHVSHFDCALRAYLAGTVRGSIDLDVEYYCRRCDNRTELISHLTRLLHTCESINSRGDVEKLMNMGLCVLHGSEKTGAKDLSSYLQSTITKLRGDADLAEVWKLKNDGHGVASGNIHFGSDMMMLGAQNGESYQICSDITSKLESSHGEELSDSKSTNLVCITSDHSTASLKLENDIDQVLQEFKRSQELEIRLVEEKLYAQKDLLVGLYQQLDIERSQLATPTLSGGHDTDSLLPNVLSRVDQIKHEEVKLKRMMQVSRGFAQTPKHILKEDFGLELND